MKYTRDSDRFVRQIQTQKKLRLNRSFRAIDGARTRGLDLGKVARYQLRHYRICAEHEIYYTIRKRVCQV